MPKISDIQLYYSTTPSAVPAAVDLLPGELAINIADGKLFYENAAGVVQEIGAGGPQSYTFSGIGDTVSVLSGATARDVSILPASKGAYYSVDGGTTWSGIGDGVSVNTGTLNVGLVGAIASSEVVSSYSTITRTSGNPRGLAIDNLGNLIESYGSIAAIYIRDGLTDGPLLTQYSAPAVLTDLAFDFVNNNLLSCSSVTDLVYIHAGTTSTISSSFAVVNPNGITFDGSNLISANNSIPSTISIHSGISATVTSSFIHPISGLIGGLAFDGTNLISGVSGGGIGGGEIYIHDGISATIMASFRAGGATEIAAPSANITGVVFNNSTGGLISCDASKAKMYFNTTPLVGAIVFGA